MSKTIVLIFAAALASLIYGCKADFDLLNRETSFSAVLQGGHEVTAVTTSSNGRVSLEVKEDFNKMYYSVIGGELNDVSGAHLYFGREGENGPVIVTLYHGGPKPGQFNGVLAEGTFTSTDFQGPMKSKSMMELVSQIKQGNVYANIETKAHPTGEIRGQIR